MNSDDIVKREQYLALVHMIIPYLMEHNAESEAIDLCIELEKLQFLEKYTSSLNYQRVCLYLTSCVAYLPTPDNTEVLLHVYPVLGMRTVNYFNTSGVNLV